MRDTETRRHGECHRIIKVNTENWVRHWDRTRWVRSVKWSEVTPWYWSAASHWLYRCAAPVTNTSHVSGGLGDLQPPWEGPGQYSAGGHRQTQSSRLSSSPRLCRAEREIMREETKCCPSIRGRWGVGCVVQDPAEHLHTSPASDQLSVINLVVTL